jgi:hypothetical protein
MRLAPPLAPLILALNLTLPQRIAALGVLACVRFAACPSLYAPASPR